MPRQSRLDVAGEIYHALNRATRDWTQQRRRGFLALNAVEKWDFTGDAFADFGQSRLVATEDSEFTEEAPNAESLWPP